MCTITPCTTVWWLKEDEVTRKISLCMDGPGAQTYFQGELYQKH